MEYDLFTSEKNLTLIVGHNGPHSMDYTTIITENLSSLDELLEKTFGDNYKNIMKTDDEIRMFITQEIDEIIDEIKKNCCKKKKFNKC